MEALEYCKECNMMYSPPVDKRAHERRHAKVLKAREHFGADFLLWNSEVEQDKQISWIIANNPKNSLPRRVRAGEGILKAWFARSLAASNFSLRHPRFAEYAASLVSNAWRGLFPEDIQAELQKKFSQAQKNGRVIGSFWTRKKGDI